MTSLLLRLRRAALRSLFAFIYGPGAALYDFVAWSSSAGQWRTWQQAALETLPEDRLLEIGHGPGHLLLQVRSAGRFVVGVDFSHQMTRMAARRLRREGWAACVVRARAQQLPFRSQAFNAAYSTFPSEYILEPASASEAARVVKPGGRIVVVPGVADITWDGGTYRGPVSLVSVGNCPVTGGLFRMAPAADPADGRLTFVYGFAPTRRKMLTLLPRAISGEYVKDPAIHQEHTTRLTIKMSPNTPLQVDGELRAPSLESVTYRVLPGKLDILTPSLS